MQLHACMFEILDLLGAQSDPTTKEVATVVSNAAQAIAHAGLAMLFFKVCGTAWLLWALCTAAAAFGTAAAVSTAQHICSFAR